jgi:hypothetical protein
LYRVFLLENTLQVDLSFWPTNELHAVGPKFSLIFGVAGEPVAAPVPDTNDLIGMAWLYALHVRSSIARSRLLQAEYMLSGMRDNVLGLMCKRNGVAAAQGIAKALTKYVSGNTLEAFELLLGRCCK